MNVGENRLPSCCRDAMQGTYVKTKPHPNVKKSMCAITQGVSCQGKVRGDVVPAVPMR